MGGRRPRLCGAGGSRPSEQIPRLLHLRQPKRHPRRRPHSELVDETTGQIGNPVNAITSYVAFRGAVLTELSVSAGNLWSFGKADIALGITPKIVKALVFDEERRVVNDTVTTDTQNSDHYYVDTDIGVVMQWKDTVRLGASIKDLRGKEFTSSRGNPVAIKAKPRIGGAYVNERYSLGLDIDLAKEQRLCRTNLPARI